MLKKMIAMTLALCLLFSILPATQVSADAGESQIYMESVRGKPGDTVTVNVYLKNNPGVMYINVTLSYDASAMKLVSVTNGEVLDTMTAAANIVWDASSNCTADGLLCTLEFQLSENAKEGQYVLNAAMNEAYNEDYVDVKLAVVSAVVEVRKVLYGDANGDDVVNGKDLMVLRKYMANYNFATGESTVTVEDGADANGDGIVNGKDLMLLRKYMANYNFATGESTVVLGPDIPVVPTVSKQAEYNDYSTILASNWNELSYQTSTDSDLINYLNGSFFTFDYKFENDQKFNADGTINKDGIVSGAFTVNYDAATKLEDVTAEYKDAWNLPDYRGYAYKITLRDDLKWDDGTHITAHDFVYTMQEQLNPLFQHFRADSYYAGSVNLVGAEAYVKQGQAGWFPADEVYNVYSTDLDAAIVFSLNAPTDDVATECSFRTAMGFPASYDAAACANYLITYYLGECAFTAEIAAQMEGKTMAEIKADPAMNAAWEALIGWWQTAPNEELDFFVTHYTYPEVSWDNVGLQALDDNTLLLILANPLELLDEEGNLTYHCVYDFSGLPLVKKDLYESCKIAPANGSGLWTSNYNSSLTTTASWGPYKLVAFEAGTYYRLEKNPNWHGWNMEAYKNQYNISAINCQCISEWETAWLLFLHGEIDGISSAYDYKNSSRAYFTPSDAIQSAQLQSTKEALVAREAENVNKTILTYTDFRKAMSLAVDRADFSYTCTASSQPSFGIFNSMHYYDVANGGVYRNTDEAKQVLCDTYAVDVSKFASLDDAVASITGYNLDEAKKLVESAYQAALADGEIDADDVVVLTFGSATDSEATRRYFNYLSAAWTKMCEGTSLEGRIQFEFDYSFGNRWANAFRAGEYDICLGGWSGAAWDPGYFLLAYLDAGYRYAAGWDTDTHLMTFTMKGVGPNGEDITETMSLMDWYNCLNGYGAYDWSSNALEESQRVQLIAALEAQILQTYYTVPILSSSSVSLLSFKFDFITYEYNTFMGYGGVRYMEVAYTEAEWDAFIVANGGDLTEEYKKP